ncbi:MAG: DUF3365 domain-containing protein [Calditrichaeota bacterium]|nr:DUF3365 domain-containing protein [Calditrichota bacterium]
MRLSAKLVLVVTGIVALMMAVVFTTLNIRYHRQVRRSLLDTARAFYNEIVVTRSWIALHTGVYVPKDEAIDSTTYLRGHEVYTGDGKCLILKTPAQVTRELSELSASMGAGFRFHITSLHPVNPRNAPTPFERRALEHFAELISSGKTPPMLEAYETEVVDGRRYLRYFGALMATRSCQVCHTESDLIAGGIRGGISVLVPMDEVLQDMRRNTTLMIGGAIAAVLVTSLILFVVLRRMVLARLKRVELAAKQLERGDYETELPVDADDEIGDLARSFQQMQDRIREYTRNLERSERKYRMLLQRSPESILVVGSSDVILDANENITRLTGFRVEEIRGKPLSFLLDPGVKRDYGISSGNGHESERYESSVRRKDGSSLPVEVYVSREPVPDEDGQSRNRLLYLRDISERKRIEAQLVENEKMHALGQLSSGIAHEIRNPLFGIRNNLEYLARRFPDDPEVQEIYAEMLDSVERMNQLVNDVLDFSRPHETSFEVNELTPVLRKCVDLVRKEFDRAHATLDLDVPENLPRFRFDPHGIEQVIINLLTNALQALRNGSGHVSVRCRARTSRGRVEIQVADDGVGIPREDLSRIFDPFFTRSPNGTGLGLTIVKRIVEQHGGRVTVKSRPGRGTTFVVEIPLWTEDEVPAE